MAARKGDSRDKILDAAEELFGLRGFDATSIRDIVAASGDTLGTLSHHFGSKNNLLRHVIERRFAEIDALRRQMLEDVKRKAGERPLTPEDVMAVIVLPFVRKAFCADQGWRSYTQLLGRMVRTNDPVHRQFVVELRTPYTANYLAWLRETLPDYPEHDLRYAYDMMITTMVGACSDIQHLDSDLLDGDREALFDHIAPRLMAFITAGTLNMLALSQMLSSR